MICPFCRHDDSRVVDSRPAEEGIGRSRQSVWEMALYRAKMNFSGKLLRHAHTRPANPQVRVYGWHNI